MNKLRLPRYSYPYILDRRCDQLDRFQYRVAVEDLHWVHQEVTVILNDPQPENQERPQK